MYRMESVGSAVKTICPPVEDLCVIVNDVRCDECGLSFRNEPRLRMHVLKFHRRKNLEKIVKENVRYHCPEISCVYSTESQRYFTQMKYLKQHYLKVHAAKTFACTSSRCDKSFSTEAARQAHLRVCGVSFDCGCCLKIFGTYEALLTHAKRTSHKMDEKYKNILAKTRLKKLAPVRDTDRREYKPVLILPRVDKKIGIDVGIQTDDTKRRQKSPLKICKRRESRQTQTNVSPKEKKRKETVETQTGRGSLNFRNKNNTTDVRLQTAKNAFAKLDLAFNDNLFPNSPLQLQHDVELQDCFWGEKNAHSSTQTIPDKDMLDAFNGGVTQTELVSFYDRSEQQRNRQRPSACYSFAATNNNSSSSSSSSSSNNNNNNDVATSNENGIAPRAQDPMLIVQTYPDKFSSIETQTEMAYSSDLKLTTEHFSNIEQLLYSNTCTQTCNDILPSDLELSDIQTQTAWAELEDGTLSAPVSNGGGAAAAASLLTSTETQTRDTTCCRANCSCTNVSSCRSWFLNNRTSHTETQTDLLSIFDEFQ